LTGRIAPSAVFDEIAAQAREFVTILGRPPAYVDAHHHAHQLPIIRQALIRAIDQKLLPSISRITIEPPSMLKFVKTTRLRRRAANWLGRRASIDLSQNQIKTNDFYFGMLDQRDFNRPFPWQQFLQLMPKSGVVEWVVHPGRHDESLIGRDSYISQRQQELQALTQSQYWESLRSMLTTKSKLWGKHDLG
jgi:predicted glycoside hydrolase/deacetylase ChbG (UPF0249 family)